MITYRFKIQCDECSAEVSGPGTLIPDEPPSLNALVRVARHEATPQGWIVADGRDLCSKCQRGPEVEHHPPGYWVDKWIVEGSAEDIYPVFRGNATKREPKRMEENSMIATDVARICHEVNKAYCESIGDDSQDGWEDAPAWQRDSALDGVKHHLSNPDSKPSDSHDNWLREKEGSGWKWGSRKNPEMKTHPCMVPFEDLPTEQKAKDFIFLAVVRSLQGFISG